MDHIRLDVPDFFSIFAAFISTIQTVVINLHALMYSEYWRGGYELECEAQCEAGNLGVIVKL